MNKEFNLVNASEFNPLKNTLLNSIGKVVAIENVNGHDKYHVEFDGYGLVVMYDFNFMFDGVACGEYFDDTDLYAIKKNGIINKIFGK